MTLPNSLLGLAVVCLLSVPMLAAPRSLHPVGHAAQTAKPPADAKPAERKAIKVPEKVLKTYVGEYELNPERKITITLESGSLWGQPTGQEKVQLFAESPTKFFLQDRDIQLTFQSDAQGNVVGLLYEQSGRQRDLKKVR